jgi:ribonuclease HI
MEANNAIGTVPTTAISTRLFFDGLCEPYNPGGVACYGWSVWEPEIGPNGSVPETEVWVESGTGRGVVSSGGPLSTNNVAEWVALGKGLRHLLDNFFGAPSLQIYGDSKLVIEQLKGIYRCNKPQLIHFRDRCREILAAFTLNWTATWIPREENSRADELSRLAYREFTGKEAPTR